MTQATKRRNSARSTKQARKPASRRPALLKVKPDAVAAAPAAPALSITACAERYAALCEGPFSDAALAEESALETVMLELEPQSTDETLTLAHIVAAELDALGSWDHVTCSATDMRRLAAAQEAVCRALQRSGARSPMASVGLTGAACSPN